MKYSDKVIPPTPQGITRAAAALADGALIGLPTETVYGLAANANDGQAVARIFDAKQRPRFNPLICHVSDMARAKQIGIFSSAAAALAARFWPGPLTLVVPRRPDAPVHDLVTAGLDSIALRVPAHPVARAVLAAFGGAIAAPSANRSGRLSPTRPAHVIADLGEAVALVLDGGPCKVGLESTIVEMADDGIRILRPGAVTEDMLAAATGRPILSNVNNDQIKAPGQMASHYAPQAPVRLDAGSAKPGELLLGFGAVEGDLNLSPAGDLVEAAANLFAMLHQLDQRQPTAIAVAPIPNRGLGKAIHDRLIRAAAAKDLTS
ncbi:MAG: L-threonylcarbamoyladenylate synthase [Sphingomonadales bacterium]